MIGPNSSAQRYKINLEMEHLFLNKEVFILKNIPVSAKIRIIEMKTTSIDGRSPRNSVIAVMTRTQKAEAEKTIMKKPFHLEVLSIVVCDL